MQKNPKNNKEKSMFGNYSNIVVFNIDFFALPNLN